MSKKLLSTAIIGILSLALIGASLGYWYFLAVLVLREMGGGT